MDTTIRNLDERAYRHLKARAALEGKTMGEAVSEAIRVYLGRQAPDITRGRSIMDLPTHAYPEADQRLSEEVDTVLYGRPRG